MGPVFLFCLLFRGGQGALLLVKQDVGALPVEILELLGADGPEEDGAGNDNEQDGDGDEDEDNVHGADPVVKGG